MKSSAWLGMGIGLLVACSPAEITRPANAYTITGAWVLSTTADRVIRLLHSEVFTPLGFDFTSADSVEVFCNPRQGERYTTYRLNGDTLRIHSIDSGDWMRFRHRVKLDTLFLYRGTDTVTYIRVNMSEFRMAPTERIYVAAGSWSWIVGLTFSNDGSMEVMSNGYESDDHKPYKVNKIYKLNRSPVPFERVSRSLQKLHYIAQSERGRQLYDSAGASCTDGAYSILWESDSLQEKTFSPCDNDFQFYNYIDYLIRKLKLDAQTFPMKMVAYDSVIDNPIFYCGHFWDSANLNKLYTLSEQLYIARHLRSGRPHDKPGPLTTTFLNSCADRYSAVLRTNGRIFQITSDKKTYYVDAGKDLIAALETVRKNRRR